MSEEVVFKYFLNGKPVEKDSIPWDTDYKVRVVEGFVYVTSSTLPEGYLATRHKAPPGGFTNTTKDEQ